MRLLTYNVRSLRDDVDAVVRVIRHIGPDLVCMQEAPRLFRWRAACAALADKCGLVMVTGGRPAVGNLLLARPTIHIGQTANILLSKQPRFPRRGAVAAVCNIDNTQIAVVGTHWDLDPSQRRMHAAELLDSFKRLDFLSHIPIIVAGDFNEEPDGAARSLLAEQFVETASLIGVTQPTFSTNNPRTNIDGIYADRIIKVHSYIVLDSPDVQKASDHRPIFAELGL